MTIVLLSLAGYLVFIMLLCRLFEINTDNEGDD